MPNGALSDEPNLSSAGSFWSGDKPSARPVPSALRGRELDDEVHWQLPPGCNDLGDDRSHPCRRLERQLAQILLGCRIEPATQPVDNGRRNAVRAQVAKRLNDQASNNRQRFPPQRRDYMRLLQIAGAVLI